MATGDADICNRALSRLGTRATIASLDESSTEARAVSIWYGATRDALLRMHDWNFARRRMALADFGGPPTGWAYRFALPVDCLRVLRLTTGVLRSASLPPPHFEVAGGDSGRMLLCDEPTPEIVYTARVVDPALFDVGFAQALVDQLAAHIAYPITQKTELAVRLAQAARATLFEAMAADAAEVDAVSDDNVPDWIAARA